MRAYLGFHPYDEGFMLHRKYNHTPDLEDSITILN